MTLDNQRWRVVVRVQGASSAVYVSPWMSLESAQRAAKAHRGWNLVVEIEESAS